MGEYFQKFLQAPVDFIWHYGLPFVLVLSVLVFVHEWGHYIVARLCGVKVETFSIGFGREIFGRTDKNGTRWKFSLIPFGGFVQMFGDTDPTSSQHFQEVQEEGQPSRQLTAEERKVAFFTQNVAKRSAIVFAGPAINFIFAILVLTLLYTFYGQPYTPPIAAAIVADSPAEKAGLRPDDKIISIDGRSITDFGQIVQAVTVALDQEMAFTVVHSTGKDQWAEDKPEVIKITPRLLEEKDRFGFKHSKGRIGITSPKGDIGTVREHNLFTAFKASVVETGRISYDTLRGIGQMIMGTRSADELGGVLRIGAYAGEFAKLGAISLITFMALLSVNLGLINLLPVPMLDGGHLFFYGIEALKGKPVSERSQEYAFKTGFVFIIFLMLFATWNDLVQLKVIDYLCDLIS